MTSATFSLCPITNRYLTHNDRKQTSCLFICEPIYRPMPGLTVQLVARLMLLWYHLKVNSVTREPDYQSDSRSPFDLLWHESLFFSFSPFSVHTPFLPRAHITDCCSCTSFVTLLQLYVCFISHIIFLCISCVHLNLNHLRLPCKYNVGAPYCK